MVDSDQARALRLLKSVFGYDAFRPRQADIIDRLLRDRNVVLVMPTGGGKSLCYQLPALMRQGVAIVVSPLISLMQDQVDALKQLGVQAEFLNSSLGPREKRAIEDRLLRGQLDLLYVAPERLLKPDFLDLIDNQRIALLAIDEAHCISQWGHDFRPEYLQLSEVRRRFPDVPCIAVTATADAPTRREIARRLHLDLDDVVVTGFDRPNIRYRVALKKRSAKQQLLRFLKDDHPDDSGIVYCLSRKKVDDTAAWLVEQGFDALPYHAGLTNKTRTEHQHRFLHEEGVLIVATIAFGMGIDKPNVRFVAHLDMPRSLESYYQETGRAGRDGLPASAWMTYGLSDVVAMRRIIEGSGAGQKQKWVELHKLNAMFGYCETVKCRRQVLLNYFGQDDAPDTCGNCDTCLHPVETWDGTVAAQMLLSCVYRTGQRFGRAHLIDVLLGKETDKVLRFGHDRVSTFGIGHDLDASRWRSVIRQLVAADVLRVDVDGYGSIRLTEASKPILKGEETVLFRKDPKPPPRKKASTSSSDEELLPQTPEERALFDDLRALRTRLAREQGVPPYVIFHDGTLLAMMRQRPHTRTEFAGLPGVGAVKLERYADVFLEVVNR